MNETEAPPSTQSIRMPASAGIKALASSAFGAAILMDFSLIRWHDNKHENEENLARKAGGSTRGEGRRDSAKNAQAARKRDHVDTQAIGCRRYDPESAAGK